MIFILKINIYIYIYARITRGIWRYILSIIPFIDNIISNLNFYFDRETNPSDPCDRKGYYIVSSIFAILSFITLILFIIFIFMDYNEEKKNYNKYKDNQNNPTTSTYYDMKRWKVLKLPYELSLVIIILSGLKIFCFFFSFFKNAVFFISFFICACIIALCIYCGINSEKFGDKDSELLNKNNILYFSWGSLGIFVLNLIYAFNIFSYTDVIINGKRTVCEE
jgi:hypothetical protein